MRFLAVTFALAAVLPVWAAPADETTYDIQLSVNGV
jgi:hypothetical protein